MSTILKLIEEFSSRTVLPVEVDHVVEFLRSCGIKDEVYFFDSGSNAEVLKGTIMHWEYPMQGWTNKVADIHTPATLSLEDKRIVQTKEMIHILDQRIDRVNTPTDVETLIVDMTTHHSEIDWNEVSAAARSDHGGLLFALPVLFPETVRQLLLPKLAAGAITIDQIAEWAVLPKVLVEFLMSELWGKYHEGLIARLRSELPVPDRVHATDDSEVTLEVHTVPLEEDPYSYAKRLEERLRDRPTVKSFIVQTRRETRTFTRSELVSYTPWNPSK